MEPVEIKPLKTDQKSEILQVYKACEDFLSLGPDRQATRAMVNRDIMEAQTEGGVFRAIVLPNGKMVGVASYVACGFEGDLSEAFILLLVLVPQYRNLGYGASVVGTIENEIRCDTSVKRIQTAVQVNNPRALRFWERQGFLAIGHPAIQPDGTLTVRMEKTLRDSDNRAPTSD